MVNREKLRLLCRLRRQEYQVVESDISLGHLTLRIARIAEPDAVLDRICREEDQLERVSGRRTPEDQLHLPYWAELWDSSIATGQHLSCMDHHKPLSVLDLGCGMGLAGAVAAHLGMKVLFADMESQALLFARLNSLGSPAQVRTRRLNWRTDRLDEQFDLILGSDILYERKQWEPLEAFWRAHLAVDGQVLLGEPGRQTGDVFPEWIRARGWRIDEHLERLPDRSRPVRMFELCRG